MTLEDALLEIHQLHTTIVERNHEIDNLHRLLKQAQRNLYGRKSEKLSRSTNQEPLFSFGKQVSEQQSLEAVTEVSAHSRRVSNPGKHFELI